MKLGGIELWQGGREAVVVSLGLRKGHCVQPLRSRRRRIHRQHELESDWHNVSKSSYHQVINDASHNARPVVSLSASHLLSTDPRNLDGLEVARLPKPVGFVKDRLGNGFGYLRA